ncbi:hypothetical protein B0H14DRAFT_2902926 [Mycena olivaceomarginata]|nr:hypothetical protein B0H14DRAFT_2902926 [Mycena olivaceomarginata]
MPSVFVGYIELAPRYSFIVLSILLPSFLLFDSSFFAQLLRPLIAFTLLDLDYIYIPMSLLSPIYLHLHILLWLLYSW